MRGAGRWALRVALAMVAVAVTGGQGEAQRLTQEVFSSGAGRVSFEFPVRDDVEVCEWGIRSNGTRTQWSSGEDRRPQRCSEGVAVAVLRIEDRHVLEIDIEPSGGADVGRYIGAFSGPEAAEFFLTIARTETAGGAEDAVAPAAFVEGEVVWRDLLDLATDRELRGGVRKAALFWVGQQAADAVTEGLREIADGDPESEIRDSAVFALSQRPGVESVPILMELARTSEFGDVRRSALFWLAQSDDDRVPRFFAEILGE